VGRARVNAAVMPLVKKMVKHFIYTENGISFEATAREANASWGKGVAIQIFDSDGALRNRLRFMVHPEFPGFEEFQSLTFEDLLDEAKAQLDSGQFIDTLSEIDEVGFELLASLNKRREA
jgi:hypothetical protein